MMAIERPPGVEHRAVLLPAPDQPGYDELPDGASARHALPARFHIPVWDAATTNPAWVCAVCWGDGWSTQWPCDAARTRGGEVFEGEQTVCRYLAFIEAGFTTTASREE